VAQIMYIHTSKFKSNKIKRKEKSWVQWCACHPSSGRKIKIGGSESRLTWEKNETLSPK
jgi:hypothetical protein